MKPQAINGSSIPDGQVNAVLDWLYLNGVRHFIPADSRIVVNGNWIIAPTMDIGRTYNPRYAWNLKAGTMPIKIRRYRIRHELHMEES
jgi:hypothetical protein